jgi:hypothetical protein
VFGVLTLTLKLPKIGGAGGESGQRVGPKYPKNTDLTFPISPKIGARGCPDLEIKLGRPLKKKWYQV